MTSHTLCSRTGWSRRFRPSLRRLPVLVLALLAVACTPMATTEPTSGTTPEPQVAPDSYRVTGAISYRERMALPADSVVTVSLEDVSLADAPSTRLADFSFTSEGRQVPFDFELVVPRSDLKARHRYAVQARITDPAGRLLWITDTMNSVDPTAAGADLGTLVLVRTAR